MQNQRIIKTRVLITSVSANGSPLTYPLQKTIERVFYVDLCAANADLASASVNLIDVPSNGYVVSASGLSNSSYWRFITDVSFARSAPFPDTTFNPTLNLSQLRLRVEGTPAAMANNHNFLEFEIWSYE